MYDLLNSYRDISGTFQGLSKLQELALVWPNLRFVPFLEKPDIPFEEYRDRLLQIERRLHRIHQEIKSRDATGEVESLLETYAEKVKHLSLSLREQCALLQARKSEGEEYYFESHPYMSSGGLTGTMDASYAHLQKLRSTHWEIKDKCIRAGRQLNDALEDPPDYFRKEYGVSDAFKEEFGT